MMVTFVLHAATKRSHGMSSYPNSTNLNRCGWTKCETMIGNNAPEKMWGRRHLQESLSSSTSEYAASKYSMSTSSITSPTTASNPFPKMVAACCGNTCTISSSVQPDKLLCIKNNNTLENQEVRNIQSIVLSCSIG